MFSIASQLFEDGQMDQYNTEVPLQLKKMLRGWKSPGSEMAIDLKRTLEESTQSKI